MNKKWEISFAVLLLWRIVIPFSAEAHEITFCGERVPISNSFVSSKLMDVIKKQIPNVNLPQLRKRARENFPRIEYYLRATGLPVDLKYVAIVESGFVNAESPAGARGFWQIMPKTARGKGLIVSDSIDERDDLDKSTRAACYILAEYYLSIQKQFKVSSWILAAAAYNVGIGNLQRTVAAQGNDYFSMTLNAETAIYVYKIIAVKELFEYPEFYLKDFGYNIFNSTRLPSPDIFITKSADNAVFQSVKVEISKSKNERGPEKKETFKFIAAKIRGQYKGFSDRSLVTIELQENFEVKGNFRSKGAVIKGTGWLIDGKVFIDVGYDHDVVIYDKDGHGGKPGEQGINLSILKDKEPILLKVKDYNFE